MNIQKWVQRERQVWHRHFLPSLLAGVLVALIAVLYESQFSNALLLGSIGASAVILTHSKSHHLAKLHTIIVAYIFMTAVSWLIVRVSELFSISLAVEAFLAVFVVSIVLFLLDAFHPPAISAAMSLISLKAPLVALPPQILAVLLGMFILIRLTTYIFSQHLSVSEFIHEFRSTW